MIDWTNSKVVPEGFSFMEATANLGPLTPAKLRWRASVEARGYSRKPIYQVEMRVDVAQESTLLILVAVDGWVYKNEAPADKHAKSSTWGRRGSEGMQVRMSANGPMKFTLEEFRELDAKVMEAYSILCELIEFVQENPDSV